MKVKEVEKVDVTGMLQSVVLREQCEVWKESEFCNSWLAEIHCLIKTKKGFGVGWSERSQITIHVSEDPEDGMERTKVDYYGLSKMNLVCYNKVSQAGYTNNKFVFHNPKGF